MAYYEGSQWPAGGGQGNWDHQTPPTRSGASSTVPREEPGAFTYQIEEVDRAIDNLMKSGKMLGVPNRFGRVGHGPGSRPHSGSDFGDSRSQHQGSNLQNFYAQQRHQPSRGTNDAEQAMQVKRRMAAQRERELRNYHQEQQYNRTVLAELSSYGNKPDRALSPGSMSEEDRRELIARQRSALYGEGPFAETGGYVDETGTARQGMPSTNGPPATLRGHSPLAYDYGRSPPLPSDGTPGAQAPPEAASGPQSATGQLSRTSSNASPQPNPAAGASSSAQQSIRRSPTNSSPDPSRGISQPTSAKSATGAGSVAPIGTRPSAATAGTSSNPAASKQGSSARLPSPLSQEYGGQGAEAAPSSSTSGGQSNPPSASADGPNVGLSGWGSRSGVWGNKSGLGVQASVWG